LVATDFSENSKRALDVAVDLAEKLNASITILNVVQTSPSVAGSIGFFSGDIPVYFDPLFYDEVKKKSEQAIANVINKVKELKPNMTLLPLVKEGNPIREIVDATKNFDLIVIGHKGLSRVHEVFMGTTSERIVNLAKCPVLIVQ
jgi:nucleotide-binding universal stress UspA family protein